MSILTNIRDAGQTELDEVRYQIGLLEQDLADLRQVERLILERMSRGNPQPSTPPMKNPQPPQKFRGAEDVRKPPENGTAPPAAPLVQKRRGRPPGSPNKPKQEPVTPPSPLRTKPPSSRRPLPEQGDPLPRTGTPARRERPLPEEAKELGIMGERIYRSLKEKGPGRAMELALRLGNNITPDLVENTLLNYPRIFRTLEPSGKWALVSMTDGRDE